MDMDKDMDEIDRYETTTKHDNTRAMSIFPGTS